MIPEGIGPWIRRRAASSPDHAAIVFRREAISYRELADRVDRLGAALQHLDVRPGDRVAYLGDNHPSFIEVLFATALVGAVFVPLNTRLSPAEIAFMLDDASPAILVNGGELESTAAAASAGRPVVRVVVGEPASTPGSDVLDYERLVAGTLHPVPGTLDDAALLIYTSGTTGHPKGAVLTHGAMTWNAINVLTDYDLTSQDRALMISPLFHVASLGMGCLPVLMKGATVLLEERFSAGGALRSIEELRATTISGVPTTYQLMTEDPAWSTTDISSLRLLTCGGSAVPDRVREAYENRGLAFSGGYGMTETSPGVTMLPASQSREHGRSAGLAHFFTRYRIRAADGGPAPAGVPGEIEVSGPNVFSGYWHDADATSSAFTEDGWLRTGDVGVADEAGFLTIVDRLKDMIISGGENVYAAEVEQAMMTIDGITGAAVVGVPHERWGEVPHAVVTLAPGRELDPEELVARLSVLLARYKVPRTLEVVDELPRTASGKVRKQDLRRRAREQA